MHRRHTIARESNARTSANDENLNSAEVEVEEAEVVDPRPEEGVTAITRTLVDNPPSPQSPSNNVFDFPAPVMDPSQWVPQSDMATQREKRANWEAYGASSPICQMMCKGYLISFSALPKLSPMPIHRSLKTSVDRTLALDSEIAALLQKQAIIRVSSNPGPGFYSHIFLVKKANLSWRPIIDLSKLNKSINLGKFRMETTESIRAILQQNDWVASIDLKDAYFHIPVAKKHQKYLRFTHRGAVYQYVALPFGLSTAPMIFTLVMREVRIMLHKINVEIHMYLDDWLLRAKSQALLQRNLNVTLDLCEQLGLEVNVAKSELIPTQKFTFLGYRYNTNSGMVYPPQTRVEDLITLVSQVQKQRPTVRKMMSLLGLMSSAEKVIPWGILHMRELQADLHGQWRRGESLESQIVLTPPSRADLQWWKEDSNLVAGLPLHPPTPQIELFTDSSTEGWGAHIESKTGSGLWSQEEKFLHINVLEMRAAHLAIRYFSQSLRNKIVLLASDNTSVVWYLKKQGGTKSRDLFLEAKHLFSTVMELGIILQARHVAGRLNVLADQLSRRAKYSKTNGQSTPRYSSECAR